MNVKNHGYCNGWCLFKELLYINVHMSIVIILIIHGGKRRVNREFFLKVLWGRVINLRNAEVRPLVLKSKCSTQGLWCVRDPNRHTTSPQAGRATTGGSPLSFTEPDVLTWLPVNPGKLKARVRNLGADGDQEGCADVTQ